MTDQEQIKTLYEEMYAAMIRKDRAALDRVHDDSFTLTHMTGRRQTRSEYIDSIVDGTLNYYSAKTEGLDIQVEGDHARMTGKSRVEAAVYGGGRHVWPLRLRFTLIRRPEGWRLTGASATTY